MSDSRKRRPGYSPRAGMRIPDERLTQIFKIAALAFLLILIGHAVWSPHATDSKTNPAGIAVSASALQHITDRHTVGGAETDGKSIFNAGESITALIKSAEQVSPVPQAGGNLARVCDAGRIIGIDRATGRQTSTYSVITTDSGQLVTAFPGRP
jgi:hypothetical protein